MKKLISLLVVAAFALTLVPVAKADQISDLMALIASLQAQIAALQGAPATTGTTCFANNLKLGMTHADVKLLQEKLGVINTGYFGPLTLAAVKTFQAANGVPSTGFVGTLTRAQLNAKYCSTTTVTTAPVGGAMSISLAATNPVGGNVQKGSADNTVLKFTLVGGSTATNIAGIVLKSYGTTEATGTTDVSNVKLYDENGVQLGSNRTPAGNAINFVVVPTLVVPANGSKTITVTASIGAGANTMAILRYGIESATSINGGTFAGNYPLIGNSYTIVPAGQLGALTVSKFGTPPKTSVKTGETNIILEKFTVSAGSNEGVTINKVVVTNGTNATISDADVSNIRIRKADGTVVGGPLTFSNKKATFILTSPITLQKGEYVNLEVVADIAGDSSSANRIIEAQIAVGDVVGTGLTSGTNMTSTSSTTGTQITIGLGTLTVSMSSSHPQGASSYLVATPNRKTLAAFDVRANGENIILNLIRVKFVDATDNLDNDAAPGDNTLTSVGLYDGDALISDLLTVDDEGDQEFALNWTIPANTTKTIYVKGITNTLDAPAPDSITTTWRGYSGYGLSSGATIAKAAAAADVSTTAITVYGAGSITPSTDTDATRTHYKQGIVTPSINVPLTGIKVYAQRENMKLTKLVLTASGSNYTNGDISSITLYDQDGTTQLSQPVTYSGATYTFTNSEFLTDIIFTKGAYRTIIAKANINASDNDDADILLGLADDSAQLTAEGVDSATAYDTHDNGALHGISFVLASPVSGQYNLIDKVVELKKAATSPSGSVSRGATTTAIWDVTNADSTLEAALLTTIKFTSKTGLPSGLIDDNDDELFKLYDGDGTLLHALASVTDGDVEVDAALGTVTFTKAGGTLLTVNAGEPKQLKLVIDTTNTAKWPSSTQLQWTVSAVADATVTNGFVGYGGTTWSLPADANIVTLP